MNHQSWVSMWGVFEPHGNEVRFVGYTHTPEIPKSVDQNDPKILQAFAPRGGVGKAISNQRLTDGKVTVEIEFDELDPHSTAEVILDADNSGDMVTIGLGANGFLANARHFTAPSDETAQNTPSAPRRWEILESIGNRDTLKAKHSYHLELSVKGQYVAVELDGVELGHGRLPHPLSGRQVGLFCQSKTDIYFRNFKVEAVRPQAFVVMQFEPPEYEELFNDVIVPVCDRMNLIPFRASQTYQPGLIIADIQRQIRESRIVIAEITPMNPNVYYEVGFADAIGKPVILIADGGKLTQLPFDVSAFRTIFYENTIGGKAKVEKTLSEFLKAILGQQLPLR